MTQATYEVAGRTVTMPCQVRDASAGTATFEVDADPARKLVPPGFELAEIAPGRCHLTLAVIDYRDNDLGDYLEVGMSLFVHPAGRPDDEVGTFIVRLPVDQAFTCEAGKVIWGFPKTVEQISLDYATDSVTATLRMDGELAFRLTLPRGGEDEMPPMPLITYTLVDGAPRATRFTQGGPGSQVLPGGDGVTLELGDHPFAAELAGLGLPATAAFTTWTERMRATFEAPQPIG